MMVATVSLVQKGCCGCSGGGDIVIANAGDTVNSEYYVTF